MDIHKQVEIEAPIEDVWRAWTTREGVVTFFAPEARITLEEGGPYELLFMLEAEPGSQGSEGCIIEALDAPSRLGFTWNFPPHLDTIRGCSTHVIVELAEQGDTTQVTLVRSGFEQGGQWDEGLAYFQRAWDLVLGRLQYAIRTGPVDWDDPYNPLAD